MWLPGSGGVFCFRLPPVFVVILSPLEHVLGLDLTGGFLRPKNGVGGEFGLGAPDFLLFRPAEVLAEECDKLVARHVLGEFFLTGIAVVNGNGIGAGLVQLFFHEGKVHGLLEVFIGLGFDGGLDFSKMAEGGHARLGIFESLVMVFPGFAPRLPGGGDALLVVFDGGDAPGFLLRDALGHEHFLVFGVGDEGAVEGGGLHSGQAADEEGGCGKLVGREHALEFLPVVVPVVVPADIEIDEGGQVVADNPLDDGLGGRLRDGFLRDPGPGLKKDVLPERIREGLPGFVHEGELAHEPARAGEAPYSPVGDFFHGDGSGGINEGAPFRRARLEARVVGAVALVIKRLGQGGSPARIRNKEGESLPGDAAQAVDRAGGERGPVAGLVAQVLPGGEKAQHAGVFFVVFDVGFVILDGLSHEAEHLLIMFPGKRDEEVLLAGELEGGSQGGVPLDRGIE